MKTQQLVTPDAGRDRIVPASAPSDLAPMERVLIGGDLSRLSESERLDYYTRLCSRLGLDPTTRPFEYLVLGGKLVLYANRNCAEQIRRIHGVSLSITAREQMEDVHIITARATLPDGRSDESTGAVSLLKEDGEWKTHSNGKRYWAGNGTYIPMTPDERANAMLKAETKAKRRVTLSIVGLGLLDEMEVETLPEGRLIAAASPALPGSIGPTAVQRKKMMAICGALGWDRPTRLLAARVVLGRKLESCNDLTVGEASIFLARLVQLETQLRQARVDGYSLDEVMRQVGQAFASNRWPERLSLPARVAQEPMDVDAR